MFSYYHDLALSEPQPRFPFIRPGKYYAELVRSIQRILEESNGNCGLIILWNTNQHKHDL